MDSGGGFGGVVGGAYPGPGDRRLPAPEGDRAIDGAVPDVGAVGVMFALWASQAGHLGLEQLVEHVQTDRDRGCEQP